MFLAIVTISRLDGSLGYEIAEKLSQRLNMQVIKRDKIISEWIAEVAEPYQLHMLMESPKFYLTQFRDGVSFKEYIEKRLVEEAEKTPSIIIGMGGQVIFAGRSDVIRVRIIASDRTRIERIKSKYGFGDAEAAKMLAQGDKRHRKYITTLYGTQWIDTLSYDLILNTDDLTVEQCVRMIAALAVSKDDINACADQEESCVVTLLKDREGICFKHPAEEEFAKILDMYGIEWEYEPRTFPVQWDAEGNVKMAFSPDFYLVKFDTYIEITTMEQKYVTTKNKKVKRLRELYPGININIVYKKDFHSLLKRFGFSGEEEVNEFNRSESNSVQ